jgi:hypothetical protein
MSTITAHLAQSQPALVEHLLSAYHLQQPTLAALTGFHLRSIAGWKAGQPPTAAAQRKLLETQRLLQKLAQLMDPATIESWLRSPAPAFQPQTPLQVIEAGHVDRIWHMIQHVESGSPA